MKKNVGAFDGVARMILAITIILYAILAGPWWLGFVALVPIVTATLFYCPVYDIIGMSTCDETEVHQ